MEKVIDMPIPTTSLAEFEIHLRDLGLHKDMDLAIHSNLLNFGRIQDGINGAYDTIRKIIGRNATIIVPTYNLTLTSETPYDPTKTPAIAMGVFSKYILQKQGTVRTLCPMHSHAIDGPKKNILLNANANQSTGPDSIFQTMMEEDFHLLLLGCSFQEGATFVHHVEANVGVPYRIWMDLPRKVVQPDGSIQDVILRYYGRKHRSNLTTDLRQLEIIIKEHSICTHASLNRSTSCQMRLSEFYLTLQNLLKHDPNIMMVQSNDE
jgi:aminoglycoside N3'-acetyltransferase